MRRTLGTAVFSGMLGVTLFGIFLTPVFFFVIEGFVESPLFTSERARQISRWLRFTLAIAHAGPVLAAAVAGRPDAGLPRCCTCPAEAAGVIGTVTTNGHVEEKVKQGMKEEELNHG